jgi:hypothetical protein
MTLGGDYDSPQKQAIRERLWDTAVRDLLESHGRNSTDLRILDLPGARCTYLRHLIDDFGFVKENMIGVERLESPFISIHHFLGGRGVAFRSEIETLCETGELAHYFPVDIANLDFCGQAFIFPDLSKRTRDNLEYQRRWDCVKAIMAFNQAKGKDAWYLLLTLACDRNNSAGKSYLLDQLEAIQKLTGITKDPSGWRDDRLIQEVVPKIIADEALNSDYIPSPEAFDSYRYVQQDHRYHMVAWKYKLSLDRKKTLGHNVTKKTEHLRDFCNAYFVTDAKELDI